MKRKSEITFERLSFIMKSKVVGQSLEDLRAEAGATGRATSSILHTWKGNGKEKRHYIWDAVIYHEIQGSETTGLWENTLNALTFEKTHWAHWPLRKHTEKIPCKPHQQIWSCNLIQSESDWSKFSFIFVGGPHKEILVIQTSSCILEQNLTKGERRNCTLHKGWNFTL